MKVHGSGRATRFQFVGMIVAASAVAVGGLRPLCSVPRILGLRHPGGEHGQSVPQTATLGRRPMSVAVSVTLPLWRTRGTPRT